MFLTEWRPRWVRARTAHLPLAEIVTALQRFVDVQVPQSVQSGWTVSDVDWVLKRDVTEHPLHAYVYGAEVRALDDHTILRPDTTWMVNLECKAHGVRWQMARTYYVRADGSTVLAESELTRDLLIAAQEILSERHNKTLIEREMRAMLAIHSGTLLSQRWAKTLRNNLWQVTLDVRLADQTWMWRDLMMVAPIVRN